MTFDMQPTNERVKAFDAESIHAGNRGLSLDHEEIATQVSSIIQKMSLAQKLNEIRGTQQAPVDGLYLAGGDADLDIPVFRMVDGPRGARTGKATAFPVAIARAASFDPMLENRVGRAMGLEVSAKNGNVILAPTINIIRHPCWGRAQEAYSEDPCLTALMGVAFVSGAQNHVLASPKHFALNNLEMTRFELSANVDERTLHEVYLPHFRKVVCEAGAASIMSAYNKVNGIYCGENDYLLTDVLRERWGFKGFVESDWFLGTRSTGPSIHAAMDIEMPAAFRFTDEKVQDALDAGEITMADIDRNVSHVLHQKLGWRLNDLPRPDSGVVESSEHLALAEETAARSFVLLKNDDVLPFQDDSGLRIAVVGDLANIANLGDRGSSMVSSTEVITPLDGIMRRATGALVRFFESDADMSELAEFDVAVVVVGLTYREEGEFIPTQQQDSEGSDLARGGDRSDIVLPARQMEMIQAVAGLALKTVVLVEGGSAISCSPWLPVVDAVMMIWYPGCRGGDAIGRVLFGDESPGGKLPVVVPEAMKDLMDWDIAALDVGHDLHHGYRYLMRAKAQPQFPFGFGLSYTSFELDGLQIERLDDAFQLTVMVRNTGTVAAREVVQVYVEVPDSSVDRVPLELKAFGSVLVEPGQTIDIELDIGDDDLCYFDVANSDWVLESTRYVFRAGNSSVSLPLESEWQYEGDDWEPV